MPAGLQRMIQATAGAIASKTVGIDQGVEMRVLDAIRGHAPRNVSEGYGDVTIKAKASAIANFPTVEVA
ncbi:hypothetical protein XH81_04480 [Bradyrhizobium sp. CCBAU 25360]|nr:hypothetical protein [Bradyrhizobium sp. CCBAU 25360]